MKLDLQYGNNDNLAPEYKALLKETKRQKWIHIDSETQRFQGLYVTADASGEIAHSLPIPIEILNMCTRYTCRAGLYLGYPHIFWTLWFVLKGIDHNKYQKAIIYAYKDKDALKLFDAMKKYNFLMELEEYDYTEYRKKWIQKPEYIKMVLSSVAVATHLRDKYLFTPKRQ